jgi:hypothetical protein
MGFPLRGVKLKLSTSRDLAVQQRDKQKVVRLSNDRKGTKRKMEECSEED